MGNKAVGLNPIVATRVIAEHHVETRRVTRRAVLPSQLGQVAHGRDDKYRF